MNIYPAIDLRGGRCVRLFQGDYGQETRYDADPVELADQYAKAGARRLHVVDLDGAKDGRFGNLAVLREMAKHASCPIQSGGGIRTAEDIHRLFDSGIERVVIGSIAIREPATVREWMHRYGPERVCLALDVRRADDRYCVTSSGWTDTHQRTISDVLADYTEEGLVHVLCTDISRDGTLTGTNVALYSELKRTYPQLEIIASGGVGAVDDLRELARTDVDAVVIGKALLDGRIQPREVLPCLRAA